MSFSQALSGLRAASVDLQAIGNNISNSQTVGFKASTVKFSDVYAESQGGLGTRVAGTVQDFTEGNVENTNRLMDLAITGNGFFRFTQNEDVLYSRNGELTLTNSGYIENSAGARLTGYPAGSEIGSNPEALRISSAGLPALATTGIEAVFNLNAGVDDMAPGTFDQNNPDTYSYTNTVTVYDSLGTRHNALMYFSKVGDNEWEVRVGINGDISGPEAVEFDANGNLDNGPVIGPFEFQPGGGADDLEINMNLAGTTQFANEFELTDLAQDGYTSGTLVRTAIDETGRIVGTYSNEQQQVLGTIALASFRNNEGLRPTGDNAWRESAESGAPILGIGGQGQFGNIASGAVESSNVDLTEELVALIIAQRNYQANAQSIKTQDEVLQTTVNLG